MTSFINLMTNDIWSDADITRRTEAMIRSEFSLDAETILNRKVIGISIGTYTPTAEDQAEIARYDQVAKAAQAAGVAARADMALLIQVFPLEDAKWRLERPGLQASWDRLQLPVVEPIIDEETGEVTNQAEVDQDAAERVAAQLVVAPHLIPDPAAEPAEDEEPPMILDPVAVAQDDAERSAAQAVIANAPQDVKDLYWLRNPSEVPVTPESNPS
jgi:hypothetical protein